MQIESTIDSFPQQSLLKSIVMYILPGALVTLGFAVLNPLRSPNSTPSLLAFLLAALAMQPKVTFPGKTNTKHFFVVPLFVMS